MTTTLLRRIVAAVATAGLLAVAAPAVSPASAAAACGLGQTCEGTLPGALGSSPYKIVMPKKFNGTVLIYSHGYRIATPLPEVLATAFGYDKSSAYSKIILPEFKASTGSDVAYIANNSPTIAPSDSVATSLLGRGYALAGVGYAQQGWAAAEGVEANGNMLKALDKGAIKGVKKTLLWGDSLGGMIASASAEQFSDQVDGVLPISGAVAGPEQAFNTAMTVLYTLKTLVAPSLKVANYGSYAEALTDLSTVVTALRSVGANPFVMSSAGFPIAQSNLLGGLMGGLPSKSKGYDGITTNPAFEPPPAGLGTAAALAAGYSPASAGSNSAAAMLENVGGAAALGILGRFELEQRIRLAAGIPAGQSANFTDNVNVSYSRLLSSEQRGEFGDILNASPVLPDALNAMLGALDSTRGNAAARFAANPKAVKYVRSLPAPTGKFTVPTLMISDTYDNIVPAGNQQFYFDALTASAKKQKVAAPQLLQYYTVPPAEAWSVIDPGAKGINAAASAANATSGVGHVNYELGGGIQLVNAVTALDKLVSAKGAAGVKAVNAKMKRTPAVNRDPFFQPEPLKRPNLQSR